MTTPRLARCMRFALGAGLLLAATATGAQQAQPAVAPPALPPLFFAEGWQQRARPVDAGPDFIPHAGVTSAAVTNAALELEVYDPDAASIPRYRDNPPPGSLPRDWTGMSCVQLAGYNPDPPPERVAAGQPSDPPNLWTGACRSPVAVTLRHRTSYVDLTGLARIRWTTRVSGFHVVRPVVKLADGSWFVGEYGEGSPSANSTLFLQSELALSSVRWRPLDVARVVTTGQAWATPDLSRVDEIGFADLMPGSGHGWGGFVNVGRFEVYGKPIAR